MFYILYTFMAGSEQQRPASRSGVAGSEPAVGQHGWVPGAVLWCRARGGTEDCSTEA